MSRAPKKVGDLKDNYGRAHVPLLEDENLSAYARLCFVSMSSFGRESRAGMKAIARRMGVCLSTARNARDELQEAGYVAFLGGDEGGIKHWKLNFTHVRYTGGMATARPGGLSPDGGEGMCVAGIKQEPQPTNSNDPKNTIREDDLYHRGAENPEEPEEPNPTPRENKKSEKREEPDQTRDEQSKYFKRKQKLLEDLRNHVIAKIYSDEYLGATQMVYAFDDRDAAAFEFHDDLDCIPLEGIRDIAAAFLGPDSWHRDHGAVRFTDFKRQAQGIYMKLKNGVTMRWAE